MLGVVGSAPGGVVQDLECLVDPGHRLDTPAEVGMMTAGLREVGATNGSSVGCDVGSELRVGVLRRIAAISGHEATRAGPDAPGCRRPGGRPSRRGPARTRR